MTTGPICTVCKKTTDGVTYIDKRGQVCRACYGIKHPDVQPRKTFVERLEERGYSAAEPLTLEEWWRMVDKLYMDRPQVSTREGSIGREVRQENDVQGNKRPGGPSV